MKTVLAFDFGASSGRAIKASFDGKKINYEEIHRFENISLTENGTICHDVPMMMEEIRTAIAKAGKIDSLAFDTWGLDYGLLDEQGELLHMPYHYRDPRTAGIRKAVREKMDLDELYGETGTQFLSQNTLFQLMVDENLTKAHKMLFMPDLFPYLLTGDKSTDGTIASTSQMMDTRTHDWNGKVLEAFGIPAEILPEIRTKGVRGTYEGIDVITIAGHDTQCAIAAMPAESPNAAFVSCGTWSLFGCELDEPVLTAESNRLELSNELGANGKINYLKNINGLWLIQEARRDIAEKDRKYSYNELEMFARECEPFQCFIDPDAEMLSLPGDLTNKIRAYCEKTGQYVPRSIGEIIRCIYESLALKYRYALEQIMHCTGKKFDVLHLLGGGTKDGFLCEMAADSINIPVIAGPIEATALGNILLQLITLGEIESIDQGRKIIAENESLRTYHPNHTQAWQDAYERFTKIIEKTEE